MRNLLQLLIRFRGLLMLILLEVISFVLIVQFNDKQNQIYKGSANAVVGSVYDWFAGMKSYFFLNRENRMLVRDNQELHTQIQQLRQRLEKLEAQQLDTIQPFRNEIDSAARPDFSFIGAKVINNSITANNNYLTLDKGKAQGVTPFAGVINGRGIVGVVRALSNNYASVMSILHRQTRISASIKGKNYFGTLVWKDNNPQFMNLDAIPTHAVLAAGDTVVTSGYSYHFPPGIVVGIIEEPTKEDGSNFYTIKVKLINDMSRVDYAYICINHRREEKVKLESTNADE